MSNQYQPEQDGVISTWNQVSREYDRECYWRNLGNLANLHILLSHIGDPAGKRIIEVGCGSGFSSAALAERGARCSLLDISPEALRVAVNGFISCGLDEPECYNEDALKNTVPSDTFDVVWNSGVLEHFYDSGKELMVKEMLRMAKPGGQVIILVPNAWCWQFQLVQAWQKLHGTWPYGFEDDMSPRRLKRICKRLGMNDVTVYAFDLVEGWLRVPKMSRIVRLAWDTQERHCRRCWMGFVSVLVIQKQE